MSYTGIDYGLGQSNVDRSTGIRYGVISQHSINLDALNDSTEPIYAGPNCPKCGNDARAIASHTEQLPDQGGVAIIEDTTEEEEEYEYAKYECADFACDACRYLFGSESAYGEEIIGYESTDTDYEITTCLDSDLFIIKAPYYTHAQFCSPCVPGAGNLDTPMDDGVRTYCLGHDWFDDGTAPYPVYRVSDDSIVEPEAR